ncbi:hypothetical protein ACE38W_20500 [Chitinophaga sp. Hz27]|uniref:hypothetical protein n=1 Tax=Chitinophaga sp. Hz27 TaxID=3347169 RepID=UPI0035DAA11C
MNKKTVLLGLNELNFEYIKIYCEQSLLPTFNYLFKNFGFTETTSESEYKLLEPWIQWVSVHTGKTYAEHQVFRLGDITERKDLKQLWEILEEKNKSIGAISPFNADNRLKNPKFFVPDPWTSAPSSGSYLLKNLSMAVQQAVNDNAQGKLTVKSLLTLLVALGTYISPARYKAYLSLIKDRKKAGAKAIILDNMLSDVFIYQWKKHQPDFSSLFLNAGAHIQHHYLFNSSSYDGQFTNPEWYCPKGEDPLLTVLTHYDNTLKQLLSLDVNLYIATGLHQKPHKHLTYYWRLKNHIEFMNIINIKNYTTLLPRMSRDFLIEFGTPNEALQAAELLASFTATTDGKTIFEIDNRGNSLFVELVYPENIEKNFSITSPKTGEIKNFENYIAFVAIKNGEHDGIGYLMANKKLDVKPQIPLTEVHHLLLNDI